MHLLGYVRVSSESQEENTSLENQERKIKMYCELNNYELIKVYRDVASGTTLNRKGIIEVMALLPSVDGVIVASLDRLCRGVKSLVKLFEEINQAKKQIISVEQHIDTTTPAGRLLLHMMASFSEYERDIINERTQQGRKNKQAAGGFAYGKPHFGKKSVNGVLVDDEQHLKIIELIRRHRRSGKSFNAIAEYLNNQAIPTKQGRRWYSHTVKDALNRNK